jgi:hypothetical protein
LVDRLAILVAFRRFLGMGAADSHSLRSDAYVRMRILFVDLLVYLFGVFGGMCDVNLCNVFLLLFMALWVYISATLFRRATMTLWHAFMFLESSGLVFFSFLFFAW